MSVKELREILTRQKVNFADCVEKTHLVDKVKDEILETFVTK